MRAHDEFDFRPTACDRSRLGDAGVAPSSGGSPGAGWGTFLAQVPLLAALEDGERRALAAACRRRTFRPGEALFYEGDPGHALYIIRSGRVKIVLEALDGRETILHISGAGECFGEMALVSDAPRSATAVALEWVEALMLPREAFLALLERYPSLAVAMIARMAEMVRRLNEQLLDALSLDLAARVCKKLLELAEQHGEPTDDGIRLRLPLTQHDLAEMAGAARSRVNACVRDLQKRGILTVERGQLTIHKPDALRERTL
jgi:CRP-like cAMP-binding protein